MACFKCGEFDHFNEDCPNNKGASPTLWKTLKIVKEEAHEALGSYGVGCYLPKFKI